MIKELYKFTIKKITEVEEVKENDDGSKTVKKVPGEVLVPFVIAKPTRTMLDDGELYYHLKYSEYLKAGIMPEALFVKLYSNENGIFSETEKKELLDLYIELGKNLEAIRTKEQKKELSKEEKDEITELHKKNKEVDNKIWQYKQANRSVLENSAEMLSKNKTIFWWILRLLYNEDLSPVFPGDTHEERLESFDKIDEIKENGGNEGEFYSKLIERASFLVSLCYLNGAKNPEEFKKLVETYGEE